MRFGIVQDGVPNGGRRFREMVEEAVLADELGFDFYGLAEAHFTGFGTSAPEVIFGAIATRTKRIKLRWLAAVLLSFNHPIRVAERLTTLDCLSDGRAELGTCRSNQFVTLEAFGVDPKDSRAQWSESLDVIAAALTQDPFEFHGEFWDIPPRTLMPKPIQTDPCPPLSVAATSIDGCRNAGLRGIGCMSGNSLGGGFDFVQQCHDTYREALAEGTPVTGKATTTFATLAIKAHCAETNEQAKAEAGRSAIETVDAVMQMWKKLADKSSDYAYMQDIFVIEDRKDDLDFLIARAPYISIGDPEFFVERAKRLEEIGVDEFILDIDSLDHEKHLQAIELIGRHVLPEFRSESTEPVAAPA
jgi:alkanesulfonate monooxygenase SsuD/methylene tetrahydromethanopterin reductase-like flavin-dependent oxidoreductase (luciferase family)